jgi:Flp pilus assembly pilin Flp
MFKQLKKLLARIHRDETGAMSVEKVLILAVIALPILIMIWMFWSNKLKPWFQGQADQLQDPGPGQTP